MGFGQAVSNCFRNYVGFSGRARRSEYWWWALFTAILTVIAMVLDSMLFGRSADAMAADPGSVTFMQTPIRSLLNAAVLLPSLAVNARRLHDIGKSGWWQLIAVIPIIGWIVMIVWAVRNGDAGANRFGPDPKSPVGAFPGSGMPQPGMGTGYGPQDRGPVNPY